MRSDIISASKASAQRSHQIHSDSEVIKPATSNLVCKPKTLSVAFRRPNQPAACPRSSDSLLRGRRVPTSCFLHRFLDVHLRSRFGSVFLSHSPTFPSPSCVAHGPEGLRRSIVIPPIVAPSLRPRQDRSLRHSSLKAATTSK